MSHDFLHDLKLFGATPAASPTSPADAACPDCVTFVAGPPSGTARIEPAWLAGDGAVVDGDPSLARVLAPNALLRVAWPALADPGPAPDPDDQDAIEEYARHVAIARFARRVIEGDPHAWVEALASYRERIRLPVPVRSTIRPDGGGSLRVGIELPPPDAGAARRAETRSRVRARYDDLCSGILLAFACDAFRVLPPAADTLYLVGYRPETDSATGHPRYAILMRLATDRASVDDLDLSRATPSAAFEYLGGAARKARGELAALAYETELARVL